MFGKRQLPQGEKIDAKRIDDKLEDRKNITDLSAEFSADKENNEDSQRDTELLNNDSNHMKVAKNPNKKNNVALNSDHSTDKNKKNTEQSSKHQPTTRSEGYLKNKQIILSSLIDAMDIASLVSMDREEAEREISSVIEGIISIRNMVMGIYEQRSVINEICSDILGYGPLEPLLERDDIEDIMVNGPDLVYIEVKGRVQKTNVCFNSNEHLLEVCQRMVSKVGRRIDEASPICDARLLDGSRLNIIIPPLAIDGVILTIRKFKKEQLRIEDLIKSNTITAEVAKILEIIGISRCNTLVSGGTGSGKTTLLNCLSSFSQHNERIVTCEDSAELKLQQPHVVRLETRPSNLEGKGEITMRDLVRNCLRMRPERIIVGEVRGPESFDLLQAMSTGHDGSMGTLHANTPREALSRLESMITICGYQLPNKTVREMIASAVDVIIHIQRLRDGSRRLTHITEVLGMEGEVIVTQDIVILDIEGEDSFGNLIAKHRGTGIGQPKFWERARMFNKEFELQSVLAQLEVAHGVV